MRELPPDIDPEGRPSLSVTDEDVEAWLGFEPQPRFPWATLEQVAVEVYAGEGWWDLRGDEHHFRAPVEIIYNGEALQQRLFALPGFDRATYEAARRAEAADEEGMFLCWRRT